MTHFLTDVDVRRHLHPRLARQVVEEFLADSGASSPPRMQVGTPPRTVLSIGRTAELTGLRVYHEGDVDEAVTLAWRRDTGSVAAVVVGDALGEIRTAALGAVALRCCLGAYVPSTVTVLGAGRQATAHLEQLVSLWPETRFLVHARTQGRAAELVDRIAGRGLDVSAGVSVPASLRASTVAVLATSSRTPVVDVADLAHLRHVTTVGPKSVLGHELPVGHTRGRRVVCDSVEQLRRYPGGAVVDPVRESVVDLAELVRAPAPSCDGRASVYISVGRTGTEIALAAALVRAVEAQLLQEAV